MFRQILNSEVYFIYEKSGCLDMDGKGKGKSTVTPTIHSYNKTN